MELHQDSVSKVFVNDEGEVTGFAEDTKVEEQKKSEGRTYTVSTEITVGPEPGETAHPVDEELLKRVKDPKDKLKLADLELDEGQVKEKTKDKQSAVPPENKSPK